MEQCKKGKIVGRSTLKIRLVSAVTYVIVIVLVVFTKVFKNHEIKQGKNLLLYTKRQEQYQEHGKQVNISSKGLKKTTLFTVKMYC